MIRFDTISGLMVIDTEVDATKEKIIITRGADGVKVQYVSSSNEQTENVPAVFHWDPRSIVNRILQCSPL